MSPSRSGYFDLIVASEKTPESAKSEDTTRQYSSIGSIIEKAVTFFKAIWGDEAFSTMRQVQRMK